MSPDQLANNVTSGDNGLWKTPATAQISYTRNGHDLIRKSEENSFWFSHRLQCLSKVISNYPIDKTLDIGGGNGRFSLYLQSLGIETVLVEPGDQGAAFAINNGVKNVIHGSLKDADFRDHSFPSVVLLDVLEHIERDEEFLQEINRILQPEGKLIITVPAFQFLFSDFDKEVGHYRRYTLADLTQKLNNSGFKVDYKTYFFSCLPIPLLVGRLFINKFRKKEKRKSTGHLNKTGILGKILGVILWPEQILIKNKIRIPFGSSCLMIVSKSETHER
ncbi:class I SAM-dependent methyltransferase [Aquimarina addita]|uniref:Class I SAM-dependent methyltransferase n=1 Tax=Aquimarina addita TaxID=870485 RepID=A0ABP6UVQ1_9FLAO